MIVCNELETIKKLQGGYSISRFGDGEFQLINGKGIHFQDWNKELCDKLSKILKEENPDKLLIGIPPFYGKNVNRNLNNDSVIKYWKKYMRKNLFIKEFLNKETYYSSFISRIESFDYDRSFYLNELTKIWKNKKVIIVTNEKTYSQIEKLLETIESLKIFGVIYCPEKNAYDKYDEIYNECLKYDSVLFLIMAGPLATILASELCKNNYQAIDIGHFFELL
jgi:glycosyltransferase family protein